MITYETRYSLYVRIVFGSLLTGQSKYDRGEFYVKHAGDV